MGLESVTKISDLNASWPLLTDERSKGDDHLRLIKVAVKSILTNPGQIAFTTLQMADGTELAASVTTRGQIIFTEGGAGEADMLRICTKDDEDNYAWRALL
jgi:hypothetical protein